MLYEFMVHVTTHFYNCCNMLLSFLFFLPMMRFRVKHAVEFRHQQLTWWTFLPSPTAIQKAGWQADSQHHSTSTWTWTMSTNKSFFGADNKMWKMLPSLEHDPRLEQRIPGNHPTPTDLQSVTVNVHCLLDTLAAPACIRHGCKFYSFALKSELKKGNDVWRPSKSLTSW